MEAEDIKVEEVEELKQEEAKEKKEKLKNKIKSDKKDKLKEELSKLKEENLDLKNKCSSLEDKLIRTSADSINYRKRKDDEVSKLLEYANYDLVKELMPIIDNFELAINKNKNITEEVSAYLEGFKIIEKNLKDVMSKFGVQIINEANVEFDPEFHNAVMVESISDVYDNYVTEVMQNGYRLKNRVIRPAMVKVNQNPDKVYVEEEIENEKKGDNNE